VKPFDIGIIQAYGVYLLTLEHVNEDVETLFKGQGKTIKQRKFQDEKIVMAELQMWETRRQKRIVDVVGLWVE